MGLKTLLLNIQSSIFTKLATADGKSLIVKGEALSDDIIDSEMYQLPGVFGKPTKDGKAVFIPLAGTRGLSVILGFNNYNIAFETLNDGETVIYSTTTDGKTKKAEAKFTNDGDIELNGNDKRLVTFAALDVALQSLKNQLNNHIHITPSGPTTAITVGVTGSIPFTIDISASETQTIKTGG